MYMADIGQGISEEVTTVTKGANLGWRVWEGSFRFVNGSEVSMETPRSDPKVTYPVVEFAQLDPLLQNSSAVTMGYIYREGRLRALRNLLLFGDNPSGEMFYINVDRLPPNGGQDAIRRILFNDKGQAKTLLDLVKAKTAETGKKAADACRSSIRRRTGWADLHPQQVGWRHSGNCELGLGPRSDELLYIQFRTRRHEDTKKMRVRSRQWRAIDARFEVSRSFVAFAPLRLCVETAKSQIRRRL